MPDAHGSISAVSVTSIEEGPEDSTLTLGQLLYANPAITPVTEKEWLVLVKAIAAGDESALRVLYEKTAPLVLSYLLRLTVDRRVAEELLVQVFQNVWCEAPVFDRAHAPVVGWILGQARSVALAHERDEKRSRGGFAANATTAAEARSPGDGNNVHLAGDGTLQLLDALSSHEREAVQAVFVDGLSYAEGAARRQQSVGTFKSRIRSGLWKLQKALQARGQES